MYHTDFEGPFNGLCNAFDKRPRAEVAVEYFEALQALAPWQWRELCAWAKHELERFPTVAMLFRFAIDHGFVSYVHRDRPDPWVAVKCSCGGSFVVPANHVTPSSEYHFICPCCEKVTYSSGSLALKLRDGTADFAGVLE